MLGGDRRLQGVGTGRGGRRRQGSGSQGDALVDLARVPQRPVLVLEQDEIAVRAQAGIAARVVQQHQRQQARHLGLVRHQRRQDAAEPDRLVAQLAAHERVGAGREIALVEDQVESRQHRAQPIRQVIAARDLVGDPSVADLALGAHDALLHGRLAGEKRACHLGSGEPPEQAQGEGHLGLARERRVAAGEEQAQAIVGYRVHVVAWIALVRARRGESLELAQLVQIAALAADAVDGAVARGADDPGAGVAGEPVAGPALDRDHEGLLHRLLGQVDVAEDPDQDRHRPSRLAPEQAVDDRVGDG